MTEPFALVSVRTHMSDALQCSHQRKEFCFEQKKAPAGDTAQGLKVHSVGEFMRISKHGWQFACKVAAGEKVCVLPTSMP